MGSAHLARRVMKNILMTLAVFAVVTPIWFGLCYLFLSETSGLGAGLIASAICIRAGWWD